MFKTNQLLVGALIVIASIFGYVSCEQRVANKELKETNKILESNANKLALEQVKLLDSLELVRKTNLKNQERIIDSLGVIIDKHRRRADKLQKELDEISSEVDSLPADSSYLYVNLTYPPIDTLRFPISGNQVKQFHKVDLSFKKSTELVNTLKFSLMVSDSLVSTYKQSTNEYKELYNINKQQKDLIATDNKNLVIEIKDLKTALKHETFIKNLAIGSVGVAAIIVIIKTIQNDD